MFYSFIEFDIIIYSNSYIINIMLISNIQTFYIIFNLIKKIFYFYYGYKIGEYLKPNQTYKILKFFEIFFYKYKLYKFSKVIKL